ncbi:hypothetical protein [Antribacter gilvus]|uniref:hypothetical protein n=1 Tax=Antribacter gilvus TaxID=2304675 RepID=UPI000F7A33FB|nr:hypothetical protein [Antribacter gilvus]
MRTPVLALVATLVLTTSACTASPDAGPGTPGADGTSGTASPGPVPTVTGRSGGQTGGEGSESLPTQAATEGPLGDLAAAAPVAGRRSAAPASGAAEGLAPGFPADVVTVPDGLSVVTSSLSVEGARYQVTLDGRADGGCGPLLVSYRTWFTGGGFVESTTDVAPGSTTATFVRDDGSVVVDAEEQDGACRVTLFGSLTAG